MNNPNTMKLTGMIKGRVLNGASGLLWSTRIPTAFVFLAVLLSMAGANGKSYAQGVEATSLSNATEPQIESPPVLPPGQLRGLGTKGRFIKLDRLSASEKSAAQQLQFQSVPAWAGSFTFDGTEYPYAMVGKPPTQSGTSRTDVVIQPVRIVFDDRFDPQGHPYVLDPASAVARIQESPLFQNASFPTGYTQYGDAVQRAEFYNIADENWHTLLNRPKILDTITVHFTRANSLLFRTNAGTLFALLDQGLFNSEAFGATPFKTLHVGEFIALATQNAFLFDAASGFSTCCILGFHGAQPFQNAGNETFIATFGYAAWTDPDVADILFNAGFPDVFALSHEVVEWINDPFLANAVPQWQFPGFPCLDVPETHVLEVGDPLEVDPVEPFPVQLNGFTYHLTNVALLPWFTRQSPSSAFAGAYSFPDTTLLTAPSPVCSGP